MSGPLRQVIGPAKARLLRLLEQTRESPFVDFVPLDLTLSKADNLQRLQQHIFALKALIKKLRSATDLLDAKNSEWSQLMSQLSDLRLEEETKTYQSTAAGDDGFVEISLQGHERIAELQNHVEELEFTCTQYDSHMPNGSHSDVSQRSEPQRKLTTMTQQQSPLSLGLDPQLEEADQTRAAGPSNTYSLPTVAPDVSRMSVPPMDHLNFPSLDLGGPVPMFNQVVPAATHAARIRLPKLALLEFNGDETKFKPFWDLFVAAVHNQDMADVEKFAYLCGLLKGKAADVITGLERTNENYQVAIQILLNRFGNTRTVKQSLYRKLEAVPKCSNRIEDIQYTYDMIEQILRQLQALQENIDNPPLIRAVVSKFPLNFLIQLEEKRQSADDWSMVDLRQCMTTVINIKKRALDISDVNAQQATKFGTKLPQASTGYQRNKNMNWTQRNVVKNRVQIGPSPTFVSSVGTRVSESRQMAKYPCIFCGSTHFPDQCRKFSTVEQRQGIINHLKLCYLCLRSGHIAAKCPSRNQMKPCFYCKAVNHNVALCPIQFKQAVTSSVTSSSSSKGGFRGGGVAIQGQKGHSPRVIHNSRQPPSFQKRTTSVKICALDDDGDSSQLSATTSQPALNHAQPLLALKATPHSMQEPSNEAKQISGSKVFPNQMVQVSTKAAPLVEGSSIVQHSASMLLTANVLLSNPTNPQKHCFVRAFLDSGSEKTFISSQVASQLELPVNFSEVLSVLSFASSKPQQINSTNVSVQLNLCGGEKMQIDASGIQFLTGKLQRDAIPTEDRSCIEQYPVEVFGDSIPYDKEEFVPDLLIGLDYLLDLIQANQKISLPSGLNLVPSKFGLLIGGKSVNSKLDPSDSTEVMYFKTERRGIISFSMLFEQLDLSTQNIPDLQDFWSVENVGMEAPYKTEDDEANELFNASLRCIDGRYHVNWLWKSSLPDLPSNQELALSRLNSQAKRFEKDPVILLACQDILNYQLAQGIIEKVENEASVLGPLHYVPHQAVVTPGRSTGTRMVFDASSKRLPGQNSFNDCVMRGRILMADLCGLLMRFRFPKYGLISDIEKTFLQIGLNEDQKDCTRFYWFRDIHARPLFHSDNIMTFRFCRVLFGAKCSPAILNMTVDQHLAKYDSPISERIRHNIYVDNVIIGADTTTEALQIYVEGKQIFRDCKMNLREWLCNNEQVMAQIPEMDHSKKKEVAKVLGLVWNVQKDTLSIPASKLSQPTNTKRQVVELTASIFDPLGFFTPVTLSAKQFIQQLWRNKYSWDESLPNAVIQDFELIKQELQQIPLFCLPRQFFAHSSDSTLNPKYNLYCFTDGSSVAYTANIYLVISVGDQHSAHLVFSKLKLVPIKGLTIPRIELMGILIGTRMLQYVKHELPCNVENQHVFTDSQCSLHWIKMNRKLPVFVENRVREIRSHKNISFQFVDTNSNPADLGTRPQKWSEFENKQSFWFYGPEFLSKNRTEWPNFPMKELTPELLDKWEQDAKPSPPLYTMMSQIMIWNKLSTTTKQKFSHLADLFNSDAMSITPSGKLYQVSLYLVRNLQRTVYADILTALIEKKSHSLIKQLNLFLDSQNVIRLRGRITNANLPYNKRHPILLPAYHPYTTLVIRDVHEKLHHAGVETTLASIRDHYWITKGRHMIKRVIRQCTPCRKLYGPPYKLPSMASLPATRLQPTRPFQYVGIDYFGPFPVKIAGGLQKIWGCLYTCFVTRAIHLEFLTDMTAVNFLNSLRRFVAKRGKPQLIITDNAPQFKLTDKTLQAAWEESLRHSEVKNYCSNERIQWNYITELSPWKGGMYERMVGLVKKCLKSGLGRHHVSFEEFITYLAEVEAIINSRPLVHVSEDPKDSFFILQPIDFLIPEGLIGTDVLEEDHDDPAYMPTLDASGKLLKYWRTSQRFIDQCWDTFCQQYLSALHERYQSTHKQRHSVSLTPPSQGAIVLIHDEQIPRGCWKIGKITKLFYRADGEIPSAEVLTSNGKTLNRSLNCLYPLEIESEELEEQSESQKEEQVTPQVTHSMTKKQNTPPHPATVLTASGKRISWQEFEQRKAKINPVATMPMWLYHSLQHDLIKPEMEKEDTKGTTQFRKSSSKEENRRIFTKISKRVIPNLYLMLTSLAICITPLLAAICPSNVTLQLVDSQSCVSESIVVKKWNNELCYNVIKCTKGHLQADGLCGHKCPCPSWATDCSYASYAPLVEKETLQNVLDTDQVTVCSFTPTAMCHEQPSEEQFYQIQLFSGDKYFMKNLNLKFTEPVDVQYVCLGTGRMTGSTTFCEHHECETTGSKFCYYKEHGQTYYLADDDIMIPIKAWGTVKVKFYADKQAVPSLPTCKTCTINCVKGGISISLEKHVGKIAVCSIPVCYSISNPRLTETVLFPGEIALNTYTVEVKVWTQGQHIETIGKSCPAEPFCESIQCYLCQSRLFNPQCTPYFALLALFVALYFGSITLLVLLKCTKYFCKVAYLIAKTLKIIIRWLSNCCKRRATGTLSHDKIMTTGFTRRRRRSPFNYNPTLSVSTQSLLIISVVGLQLCTVTMACSEATTLTAQEKNCNPIGDRDFAEYVQQCTINEATRIALVPQGQETCLLIKKPDGEPLGTLKLRIQNIYLHCNMKNEYFTRSFQMRVSAVKRCPTQGTCSGEKCNAIKKDTKIKELSDEANNNPGYSFCVDSCGCAACGCFFCTDGCLFYRVYAFPTTATVYEVFSCSSWTFKVETTLQIEVAEGGITRKKNQHKMILEPGIKKKWRNFELTLIGLVDPPSRLLHQKFVTDGNRMVMIEAAPSGQPISGMIGDLQCADRGKAQTFECYFPFDICSCQPHEEKVGCTCTQTQIEKLFKKEEYVLPLQSHGITIQKHGESVRAEFSSQASLEVQISMKNLKLAFATHQSTCYIQPIKFQGCYKCLTGAKLHYKCTTDKGESLAHIQCDEKVMFTSSCKPTGFENTVILAFANAVINKTCYVTCPAKSTQFQLHGLLVFIPKNQLNDIANIVAGSPSNGGGTRLDFNADLGYFGTFLTEHWFKVIIIVVLVILLVVCLTPLLPAICTSCIQKCRRMNSTMTQRIKDLPYTMKRKLKMGTNGMIKTKNV